MVRVYSSVLKYPGDSFDGGGAVLLALGVDEVELDTQLASTRYCKVYFSTWLSIIPRY